MKQTCETCDWWCYGTYPDATCDKWEQTLAEIDVDDDIINKLMGMPTSEDIGELLEEIEKIENEYRETQMNGLLPCPFCG